MPPLPVATKLSVAYISSSRVQMVGQAEYAMKVGRIGTNQ